MILILSDGTSDKSVNEVIDWINFLHGKCIRINSSDILHGRLDFLVHLSGSEKLCKLRIDDQLIDINDINVIWNWRWAKYELERIYKWSIPKLSVRRFMNDELNSLFTILRNWTRHKYWLGDIFLSKVDVLNKAKNEGLLIPETIVTRSKKELLDFYNYHGDIITKPLSNPIFFNYNKNKYATYTTQILEEDILSFPDYFFSSMFQKKIDKDFEVRTFVLDRQIYSAAIISQNDSQTQLDFRNYNMISPNRIVPYNLPGEIEVKVLDVMDSLNLKTGSIDFIYKNGDLYFLEINPVGQYDMISQPCNYKLSKQIAEFLISQDK